MSSGVPRAAFALVPSHEACDFSDELRIPDGVEDLILDLAVVGLERPTLLDVLRALRSAAGALPELPLRRPDLPEVLTSDDVATALGITVSSAQRLIREGKLGPKSQPGKRFVIRRDAFLEHLRSIETDPVSQRKTPAKQRFIDMLKD